MKILMPVDGSQYSRMAARMLLALKLSSRTEIEVMTVVPEQTFLGGLTLDNLWKKSRAGSQFRKVQEETATKFLEETVAMLRSGGLDPARLVSHGKPAERIIEKAEEMEADLVIMGAKGVSDTDRFPLGNVAQSVMRHAGCSVLLVKEEITRLRRVLVGVDGSGHSEAAIRLLIDLPIPHKAEVFLITALQSHTAALLKMPDMEADQNILAELQASEETQAGILLERTERQFSDSGYNVSSFIRREEPASEILAFSKTLNPELVVVGAQGLTGIEPFLIGSVARRVARFSRYSVLIARPPEHC